MAVGIGGGLLTEATLPCRLDGLRHRAPLRSTLLVGEGRKHRATLHTCPLLQTVPAVAHSLVGP